MVDNPITSVKFTACRVGETEHSGFNLSAGMARCLRANIEHGISPCETQAEGAMAHAAMRRRQQPLPLGTAMLSNFALSLLLWNIAFRVAGLLLAG
jgi:hypothetical protein